MRAVPVISISIIKGGIRGVLFPLVGSEVVVVKFARLRREVVTGAVLVAPAFLAKADAFYRGVWARSNNPTLLVLIDAVAGKPAGDDLRLQSELRSAFMLRISMVLSLTTRTIS